MTEQEQQAEYERQKEKQFQEALAKHLAEQEKIAAKERRKVVY